ncbi:unnamed protein product [Gadus morhua 'NCC']
MMWNSHDSVGFAVLAGLCFQMGFSFEGQFTDLPSNTTALEGQNIEMACAFQSGTASVYLEIEWWFFREPVPSDSSEDVHVEELETPVEVDPDMDGNKISTVKVQGNDISHKLQISRVSKNDEGLYECRVTLANYGELLEHKAQAWLKVNSTLRPQRPTLPVKKSSPLHLTDKKPRKPSSPLGPDTMSGDQMAGSTSSSREPSKSAKHIPSSGTRTSSGSGPTLLLLLLLGILDETDWGTLLRQRSTTNGGRTGAPRCSTAARPAGAVAAVQHRSEDTDRGTRRRHLKDGADVGGVRGLISADQQLQCSWEEIKPTTDVNKRCSRNTTEQSASHPGPTLHKPQHEQEQATEQEYSHPR